MFTNKNTEGSTVAQGKSETKAMEEVETIKKDLRSQRKEITNLADKFNELKIELKKEQEDNVIRITGIRQLLSNQINTSRDTIPRMVNEIPAVTRYPGWLMKYQP